MTKATSQYADSPGPAIQRAFDQSTICVYLLEAMGVLNIGQGLADIPALRSTSLRATGMLSIGLVVTGLRPVGHITRSHAVRSVLVVNPGRKTV